MDNEYYVIRADHDNQLFWSNDLGWVETELETRFDPKQKQTMTLPIGGQWVYCIAEDVEQ